MKRFFVTAAALLIAFHAPRRLPAQERGAAALGELVAGLGVTARVLVVGAHPDDEDTRLIAWLVRGRHVETAYLSLTRGDGGQNLIGKELGEALGAIRTEELLTARRIDGGTQYFARAYDYGFSKSADEAFTHWPHDSLLNDVVTVVRTFRPHVIVSVFSGTPRDGHGQHQAAGILAREAYDLAGDTARFPTGRFGPAWTPSKFYRSAAFNRDAATLAFNVGEYSPLLGRSYAEIAAESRSQHKSQAFGSMQRKGVIMDYVTREATRAPAPRDPKQERSLFDGVDTTLQRLRPAGSPAGVLTRFDTLSALVRAARTAYDPFDPSVSILALARARRLLTPECDADAGGCRVGAAAVDREVSLAGLRARVDRALATAAGLAIEAAAEREIVASGDSVPVTVTIYNRRIRDPRPVRVLSVRIDSGRVTGPGAVLPATVLPDSVVQISGVVRAAGATSPWWLAEGREGDMFRRAIDRRSESQRSQGIRVEARITVGTTVVDVTAPVVYRYADPVKGDVSRPLAVAPAVSVTLDRTVEYAPANTPLSRGVQVHLRSASTRSRDVTVRLALPPGLRPDSAARTVTLPGPDAQRTVTFRVRGTLPAGRHTIGATAESGGEAFTNGYVLVDYDHIRPQRLYRDARLQLQAVDVKLPAVARVAYVPGASDNVAPALQQLRVPLTVIQPAAVGTTDLSDFGAVILGPRVYESSPELVANNARLLDYARAGGTLVVQYQQYEITQPGIAPYPMTVARPHDRVTDENAPVRVLDSAARVLNVPNRITPADFAGWVQERSLYMPRTFDDRYHPVLSMNDPGAPANSGAILVAPVGRGTYVYTTLSFFRQLPAGNAGAARLFANLIGAGRREEGRGVRAKAATGGRQ